jgi:hypothetical protein
MSRPPPIRRFRREVAFNQIARLAATILDPGGDEPAPTHTGRTGSHHQSRNPLAANANALDGMRAGRAVGAARSCERSTDCRDHLHHRPKPSPRKRKAVTLTMPAVVVAVSAGIQVAPTAAKPTIVATISWKRAKRPQPHEPLPHFPEGGRRDAHMARACEMGLATWMTDANAVILPAWR